MEMEMEKNKMRKEREKKKEGKERVIWKMGVQGKLVLRVSCSCCSCLGLVCAMNDEMFLGFWRVGLFLILRWKTMKNDNQKNKQEIKRN